MPSALRAQIVATGVGVATLVSLITSTTYWLVPQESFFSAALIANTIATLTAIAAWSGALFERKNQDLQPVGATGWIVLFLFAAPLSALFLSIDCGWHFPKELGGSGCNGHPGLSVIFTVAALGLAAIALPSAIRAWLLKLLSPAVATSK